MKIEANLGHPNNPKPIGQLSGVFSNSELSPIQDVSQKIVNVLDYSAQEQINNSQNRLGFLLSELKNEVESISSRTGYSYDSDDYNYRLAQPKKVIDKTFKLLLKNNNNLNKIYKELCSLFKGYALEKSFKVGLYKEYLEKLVYESINHNWEKFREIGATSMTASTINVVRDYLSGLKSQGIINYRYLQQTHPEENSYKQFHKEQVKLIGESGVTYLDATDINIWMNGEDLIQFIKSIGKAGVRFINLSKNILGKIINYDPDLLSEFIKTAGESGIKSIDLTDNGFDEVYESLGSPAELVRIAGLSGIKNINLGSNFFDNITSLNKENIIEFIKTAGESGIKSIGLGENGLNYIFSNNFQLLMEFIKAAGESGIKSINLGRNNLINIFTNDIDSLIEFITVAGKYGIRSLDLESNDLFETIGEVSVARQFLDACKNSEIVSINVDGNDISHFKSAIPDIDEIIKQLHYGSFN